MDYHALTYTLYSHNLTSPSRSFASDITIKDFKRMVDYKIKEARKVVYVNPRGTSIILKDKNGTK